MLLILIITLVSFIGFVVDVVNVDMFLPWELMFFLSLNVCIYMFRSNLDVYITNVPQW